MVIAGIRKRKTHGASKKNLLKSANPYSKMLNSPLKTQRNNPFSIKKSPIIK